MLTYQLRPRVFRPKPGEQLTFPAQCELRFHFQPLQPFGAEPGGGRTAVRAVPAVAFFDPNTGHHTIQSNEPLSALQVILEEPSRTIRLIGATLTILERFESLVAMERVVTGVFFVLPSLLNISFADPPYIERVDGRVGSSEFRWELATWRAEFVTTTQELQVEKFAKSWERMKVVAERTRRRLLAGLHYFHSACRLARVGCTPGEFVAEVLLNLTKSLEVLFPPGGDGRTRDSVRAGLRNLGFSDERIECDFISAMALRDQIDVGHVELGLFTVDQLKTIHAYTERCEGAFRGMFELLLARTELGEYEVASHELGDPKGEAIRLIERLRECMTQRTGLTGQ